MLKQEEAMKHFKPPLMELREDENKERNRVLWSIRSEWENEKLALSPLCITIYTSMYLFDHVDLLKIKLTNFNYKAN